MLYLENQDNTFTRWRGERIAGIAYPLSIESKWSPEQLADVGLYAPAPASPVPQGKVPQSVSVQRVDGVVRFVRELADAPPPAVPKQVTARAARLALNRFGLRDDVEAAVEAADRDTQDYWLYSQTIGRTHAVMLAMAAQLGLTGEQLDALFVAADEIDRLP